MADYTTSSGATDLNGTMTITGTSVTAYNSTSKGTGTITNDQSTATNLNFKVGFSGVQKPYHITANANANGNGYSGNAKDDGTSLSEDTWAATASTGKPDPDETYSEHSAA
jgi:hypothetical protein